MAARYLVPGGDGNYNSTSNWSATSGGASGASFPVAADDIIINNLSFNAPLNINVLSACRSFAASNYTGTVTMTNNLSVNGTTNTGNITLSAGMTITGNGTFIKIPTGTTGVITSNGAIFDCNFTFSPAAATITVITGNMQVNKNLTFSLNSTAITTINGTGTISVGGDLIHNGPVAGVANIQLIGSTTATITQVATRVLSTNLIINKTGIWNQVDLYWGTSGRTLTYTSGVVNITGTLFITACTLNTNGINWNNVIISGSGTNTILLNSLFTCNIWTGNGRSLIFSGTGGINVNSMILNAAVTNVFLRFINGVTYRFNNNLTVTGPAITTLVAPTIAISGSVGAAKIILGPNAICKLLFVKLANIDASEGKALVTLGYDSPADTTRNVTATNCKSVYVITKKIEQYNKTI